MNMKHTVTVICLIGKLLNIACADPLKEGDIDVASIDYLQAYRLVYVPAKARIADQKVFFFIKSRLKGVALERISLTIQTEARQIPIAISKSGTFTLPFSEEMIARNPKIVSNQPKGTLSLECFVTQMCVPLGESGTLEYRDLMEPMIMLRTLAAIIDGERKEDYPATISFCLDKKGPATVILHDMKGRMESNVDREIGLFNMPFSGKLMEQNPLIQFPKGSHFVFYVEDCGMAAPSLTGRLVRF
jgi:hypothetical protein